PAAPASTATSAFPYTTLFRSEEREDHEGARHDPGRLVDVVGDGVVDARRAGERQEHEAPHVEGGQGRAGEPEGEDRVVVAVPGADRKSTRLNSSHGSISYAVF